MIAILLFSLFAYVFAKPVGNEIEQTKDFRLSFLPPDFQDRLKAKPEESVTGLLETLPKYSYIPEVKEIVKAGNYFVYSNFPTSIEPLTVHYSRAHIRDKLNFIALNGYTDDGAIAFSYKKMLPEFVSSIEYWNYDDDTKITLRIPITVFVPTFQKTLLRSRTEIEDKKYKITTLLPGFSKKDIHFESYNEYFYTKVFKDNHTSYEEIRMWPPCASKEYQWEYSEDVLTVRMTLNEPCV